MNKHDTSRHWSAAGSAHVAHLASDKPERWTVQGTPKAVMTGELWSVVSHWTYPSEEMVAYRLLKDTNSQISVSRSLSGLLSHFSHYCRIFLYFNIWKSNEK